MYLFNVSVFTLVVTIMCICSNWGTENDPEFKGYCSGNKEGSKGFGINELTILVFTTDMYYRSHWDSRTRCIQGM